MPDLTVQSRHMGAWQFDLENGQVQAVRVSVDFVVAAEGQQGAFSTLGGQDINIWPLMPQAKKTQLQAIVTGVLSLIEEV